MSHCLIEKFLTVVRITLNEAIDCMNTFHPAEEVIEHFRKNNVLIGRRFPPMDTYIRISLGRPEEIHAFWRTWVMLPYPKHSMQH
jgi:hypothetical protein